MYLIGNVHSFIKIIFKEFEKKYSPLPPFHVIHILVILWNSAIYADPSTLVYVLLFICLNNMAQDENLDTYNVFSCLCSFPQCDVISVTGRV